MTFGAVTPVLRIFDEKMTHDFYIDFLGFKKDWEHRYGENFPLYMQVSRDQCILNLSGHFGDGCPGSSVRIEMTGVEEFSKALLAKDYKHAKPGVEKTKWNTIETTLKDPAGNTLIFFESVSSQGNADGQ